MTHVLRIAHLRIALHVANPEVGKREGIRSFDIEYDQHMTRVKIMKILLHLHFHFSRYTRAGDLGVLIIAGGRQDIKRSPERD